MTTTNDLDWRKGNTVLPEEEAFGWTEPVLVYDPSNPDLEPFYVGAYSHNLQQWQVCGSNDVRGCKLWCLLTVPML